MTALIVAAGAALLLSFEPPAPDVRQHAIGPAADLPEGLRIAFDPLDDFEPVPEPGPDDWLANHPEPGQTFLQFTRRARNVPDEKRTILCLQPLGGLPDSAGFLADLCDFAGRYFAMPVRVLDPIDPDTYRITRRQNPWTHQTQLLSTDILEVLKTRLPEDGFCILAVTLTDLYPEPSWNFVFGQASIRERVGVFSFARYDPGREHPDAAAVRLWRSARVLAHETGHMFGLAHCIYFHCLMNGSNHLREADSRPTHLCPVCLRKLHHSLQFDPVDRYIQLHEFYRRHDWAAESQWLYARLEHLLGPDEAARRLEPESGSEPQP